MEQENVNSEKVVANAEPPATNPIPSATEKKGLGSIDDMLKELYAAGKIKAPRGKVKPSVKLAPKVLRELPKLAEPLGPDWRIEKLMLYIVHRKCTSCGNVEEFSGGVLVRYRDKKDPTCFMDTTRPHTTIPPDLERDIEDVHDTVTACGCCFHYADTLRCIHTHYEKLKEINHTTDITQVKSRNMPTYEVSKED